MRFVADENLPKELIIWLEKNSHQLLAAPKGSPDEEVALLAKKKNSILLTQDRHFANTLRFPPKNFPGIVKIKIHPAFIEELIFSLEQLLKIFPRENDFRGKLIILEKDGYFKLKE